MIKKAFLRGINLLVLLALSLAIGVTGIFAQNQTTGAIGGKVMDPQSAVIPNATVTITNLGTNKVTTVNVIGRWRIPCYKSGARHLLCRGHVRQLCACKS